MTKIVTNPRYGKILTVFDRAGNGHDYVLNKDDKVVYELSYIRASPKKAYIYGEYIPIRKVLHKNGRIDWVSCSGEYTWDKLSKKIQDGDIQYVLHKERDADYMYLKKR